MEQDAEAEYPPLRMAMAQVERLEAEIDAMNDALEPLRSFILPGGSPLAAPPAASAALSPQPLSASVSPAVANNRRENLAWNVLVICKSF